MTTYAEKLKDPRWQKKRLKILERDNFTCQVCGDTEKTLHVHHSQYDGNPWDVEESLLITLCDDCHNNEHRDGIGQDVKAFALDGYRTKVEALEMSTCAWMMLGHLGRPVHQFRELAQWLMEYQDDDRTLIEKLWDDYQFDITEERNDEVV